MWAKARNKTAQGRARSGQARAAPSWTWTVVGLALAVTLWGWGSTQLSSIALPSPVETAEALARLTATGAAFPALLETGLRVIAAFCAALVVGAGLGLAAGFAVPVRAAIGPLVTMLLAVPPIAWVVLALIWFGTGSPAVMFTVFIAVLPIIFLAAVEGMRTVDPELSEMVKAFRMTRRQMLRHVTLPHLGSYLLPACITAFGIAWKVCVMAELLSAREGVGSGLADARANLDTAETFAWLIIVVSAFLLIEALVLRPAHRWLQPWRAA